MNSRVSVRLFGIGQMVVNGRNAPWPIRSDIRKLLLYLLIHWPLEVDKNSAAVEMWPDVEVGTAKSRLRRTIYRLNIEMSRYTPNERWIVSSRTSLALTRHIVLSIDHADFLATPIDTTFMTSNESPRQINALIRAEDLARQPLLSSYSIEWIATKRAEAIQLRHRILATLVNHFESTLEYDSAAHYALELARTSPLSEIAYRRVVSHLLSQSNTQEATSVMSELFERTLLEIGTEPSASVLDLARQLGCGPTTTNPATPLRATTHSQISQIGNLPSPRDRYIYSSNRIASVSTHLANSHQVTLVGLGGIGKTRLALQYGHEHRSRYPGGIWVLELLSIKATPHDIVTALEIVVGVDVRSQDWVCGFLDAIGRDSAALLILDNCERHRESAGEVIVALQQRQSMVDVIITSRIPLGIPSEAVYELTPLPMPGEADILHDNSSAPETAVSLFLERMHPLSELSQHEPSDFDEILELCRLLEGLPLAIEIAAGHTSVLRPSEIRQIASLHLLELRNQNRLAPPHHSSLSATLEWTYNLLTEVERRVIRHAAVFSGSFDQRALQSISSAVVPLSNSMFECALERLRQIFLLRPVDSQSSSERFYIAPIVREYLTSRLDQEGSTALVHHHMVTYYLDYAEAASNAFLAGNQHAAIDSLRLENQNLIGLLHVIDSYTLDADALRLAGATWRYWYITGQARIVYPWLARHLAASSADSVSPLVLGLAHDALGALSMSVGNLHDAVSAFRASAELLKKLDMKKPLAQVLLRLAQAVEGCGDLDEAIEICTTSAAIADSLSDSSTNIEALTILSSLMQERGMPREALRIGLKCLARTEDAGSMGYRQFSVLTVIGDVLILLGDYNAAERYLHRALRIAIDSNSRVHQSLVYDHLGRWMRQRGKALMAKEYFRTAIEIDRSIGDSTSLATTLCNMAELLVDACEFTVARLYLDESRRLAHSIDDVQLLGYVSVVETDLWIGERSAGSDPIRPQDFSDKLLSTSDLQLHALLLRSRGLLQAHDIPLDKVDSFPVICEALRLLSSIGSPFEVVRSLEYLTHLLVQRERISAARVAFAIAEYLRGHLRTPRPLYFQRYLEHVPAIHDCAFTALEPPVSAHLQDWIERQIGELITILQDSDKLQL